VERPRQYKADHQLLAEEMLGSSKTPVAVFLLLRALIVFAQVPLS
jgi:hypothetical protein